VLNERAAANVSTVSARTLHHVSLISCMQPERVLIRKALGKNRRRFLLRSSAGQYDGLHV
jgi:hypothetical protein